MRILSTIILVLSFTGLAFASGDVSRMFRTGEALEKERLIRQELRKPEKFYIKEIILQDSECLTTEELDALAVHYKKHWLTKDDIAQLIRLLRQAYKEKGCTAGEVEFSYQIKKRSLVITAK